MLLLPKKETIRLIQEKEKKLTWVMGAPFVKMKTLEGSEVVNWII